MDIITSVAALRERLEREPDNVFVPTMGNLHQGHIQLMRLAKRRATACTVVSIFVNRLQFGPKEDFDRYPRTLQSDSEKMKDVGVDVVFAPDEAEIYPEPQTFVVEPSDLQHILEGAFRPGHFRGVATVVLKLFNMVRPHTAIFGKKDYQQYVVLRDMVKQHDVLLIVLLAENRRVGPHHVEQFQHDGGHAAEVAGPERAFEDMLEVGRLDDEGLRFRIDFGFVRREHHVHSHVFHLL